MDEKGIAPLQTPRHGIYLRPEAPTPRQVEVITGHVGGTVNEIKTAGRGSFLADCFLLISIYRES